MALMPDCTMAMGDVKMDETSKLLDNVESNNYTDLPQLKPYNKSLMSYPSHSLTNLLKSSHNIKVFKKSDTTDKLIKENNSIICCTRLGIGYFSFLFIIAIIAIIICFTPVLKIFISFIILIILSFFGSLIGMKLIYDWDIAEQQIFSKLKSEMSNMETERETLQKHKHNLKINVKGIQGMIHCLNHCVGEIENELKQFDELQLALKERANESQTIHDVLNEFDSIINSMQFVMTENSKAAVLSQYYEVAFKGDYTYGLSKDSFKKFLQRLDSQTRAIFKESGGFDEYDKDSNGTIEVHEFMEMLEFVLKKMQTLELQSAYYN
eukprot:308688_1